MYGKPTVTRSQNGGTEGCTGPRGEATMFLLGVLDQKRSPEMRVGVSRGRRRLMMGGKGGVKGKAGDEGTWSTWVRQGMGMLVRKTRVMMN
jgi:hypothetical protein